MARVSVIVPNYNHAKFLNERLTSILNQSYQDFEVIILDDCSTDNSREVIESFRNHPKISHIVLNEQNSGTTFKQWETGISLAKGDFIWIAESDDWCELNLLEALVNGITGDNNCVIAYAQSYTIINNNDIHWISKHTKLADYVGGADFIKTYMLRSNAIYNASMALFKKSAFAGLSKEYTTFKFCGDWLFWIEIAKKGTVFISGKYLNFFRKHDKDVSGKAFSTGFNFIEETRLLSLVKESGFITDTEYFTALFGRYLRYRAIKPQLSAQSISLIEEKFYADHSVKSKLIRSYFKHAVKKKAKKALKAIIK